MFEEDQRGFLCGPNESEETFYKRCKADDLSTFPPSLKELFAISPNWVPVHYKDSGLRFWEGGCSWIEGTNVEIQLKEQFAHKKTLWKIYSKEEILAHEGVHAARVAFEEPIFEEVLAYQTSKSRFRRFFGPFFRSPKETLFFALLLPLSFFSPFFAIGVVAFGLMRLIKTQATFLLARKKLGKLYGKKNALPIMLHLTDKEIILFAKGSIKSYVEKQTSLRWQQIKRVFSAELYSQSQAQSGILQPSGEHMQSPGS
ncbi:MAG: hypothetical protein S4CHLAM45_10680 [Chlamydiales bacterium]|nr:hypothetical protein [Chlamydiales bacterium]MCH9619561.1 hypothetical protein [Chlamydiales bacterium]MCH9623167.1 hypothetical protein [Chlamydiales bacterium]